MPGAEKGQMIMKAGIYHSSARAMNGEVEVELEVSERRIENLRVIRSHETPGIGTPLYDKDHRRMDRIGACPELVIPERVVEKQSLAVPHVPGARVTSMAILRATEKALTLAGADISEWKKKNNGSMSDEEQPMTESDFVIVGGGGAGFAAAIEAGRQGKSVTILEKCGEIGGNTMICGSVINALDPKGQAKLTMTDALKGVVEQALSEESVNAEHAALQDEVRKEWQAYLTEGRKDLFDTPAWYTLQTWNGGDRIGDLKLIRRMVDRSQAAYEWLKDLGMQFDETPAQGAGALWQRSHVGKMEMGTGFISTFLNAVDELLDVQIKTGRQAVEILTRNGRVTGVKAVNESGCEEIYTAKEGVLLACGGYSANRKMVQEYNTSGKWTDLGHVPTTNRTTCAQGEGIQLAEKVGAGVRDMDQIQLLYLGNLKNGNMTKYPPRCVCATPETIFVNQNGDRFVREDGRRDNICSAILRQPGQKYYIIESADGAYYTDITSPDWRSGDGFTREYLEENGYIQVADTLEGLAEKINVNPERLCRSVESYNACAEQGKDGEFGRVAFGCKLEHGPYTATVRQVSIHYTMGGLTIDPDTHVLDKKGDVIPGLYAAGEITGGIHGGNRLGGNAIADIIVFGLQAAESMIKDNRK